MNAKDFKRAVELAHERSEAKLPHADLSMFDGCGLKDYRYPVYVRMEQVADLIRYQCFGIFTQPDGSTWVDHNELENVRWIARHKFQVVKPDLAEAVRAVLGPGMARAHEIFGDAQ